jgi:hypothetical protein
VFHNRFSRCTKVRIRVSLLQTSCGYRTGSRSGSFQVFTTSGDRGP